MKPIGVVYVCSVVRVVGEGYPVRDYDCGYCHGGRGEEDNQSSTKDYAPRQHAGIVISETGRVETEACHFEDFAAAV